MSGNLTAVREMSGILLKIREMSGKCQGKNLISEKLPKTVYCKLQVFSRAAGRLTFLIVD